MRIGIERLRVWLLVSAALLVTVIAGFIGTARYLRRHWLAGVPEKLGANVKVDTSGVTYSHTYQGHTDYIIHAAKDVEHTDGTFALHDVWMKVCGRQQRRADIVRGDDWEWNQKTGVIRALGVVHIELRPNNDQRGCAAVDDSVKDDAASAKSLRVTTSNLIYMNQLGVAATSAPIEFESGTLQGHAVGADYASDSGTLLLHSAVSMTGLSTGRPVELHAASAEMDGQDRVVRLTGAKYVTGEGAKARTAAADQAVLHLRADQTLERIEAQGNVTMQSGNASVASAKTDVTMNAAGHPVSAVLTGGVRYAAIGPQSQQRGDAQQATITFDGKASSQAEHALFIGEVHLVARNGNDAARANSSTRELSAAKVDLGLAPDRAGKNVVRDAEATGGAMFKQQIPGAGGKAPAAGTTEIAADGLTAHFAETPGAQGNSPPRLDTITGQGHTWVRRVDAKGIEQTSAGDTLNARFRQGNNLAKPTSVGARADLAEADSLAGAVQTGHVTLTRKDAKPGSEVERATAQQASYDGDSDRMTLTGGVQLSGAEGDLWASQLIVERATGNAQASGAVKAEYAQTQSGRSSSASANREPAHVIADWAEMDHARGAAIFHGAPVRMWQAGSQLEAPVIEVDRAAQRLIARGENGDGPAAASRVPRVRTLLMGANGATAGPAGPAPGTGRPCPVVGPGAGKQATTAQPEVLRIVSGAMVYSKTLGEAEFTGGFRVDAADQAGGTIRANSGIAYLDSPKEKTAAADVPVFAGKIDRIVAAGRVLVERPGLRATGERLVYTAAGQNFMLTGDAENPPRATDARGSTTTAAALEFHRGCNGAGDTVEALGSLPGGPAGQVHTESSVETRQTVPAR